MSEVGQIRGDPAHLVTLYACMLDARDWAGFRSLFTDEISLDYGAIGSLVGSIDADSWALRCRALEGFDATAHRLSNIRTRIEGDRATVDSYIDAVHFITIDGAQVCGHLVGHYRHTLVQAGGAWLIDGCTLHAAGYPGGQALFAAAFVEARARFAAISSGTAI